MFKLGGLLDEPILDDVKIMSVVRIEGRHLAVSDQGLSLLLLAHHSFSLRVSGRGGG